MAPEQLRGEPLDGRADVYSLGGDDLRGADRDGCRSAPDRFSTSASSRPRAACGLNSAGMAPALARGAAAGAVAERDERPATAGAFAEALSYVVSSSRLSPSRAPSRRFSISATACRSASCARMFGRVQLLLQLGARQASATRAAAPFRIFERLPVARGLALFLQFVHAFLESGISVNQSFACITHESTVPFQNARSGMIIKTAGERRSGALGVDGRPAVRRAISAMHQAIGSLDACRFAAISSTSRCGRGSRVVPRADAAATARLAGDRARRVDADSRADRHGQDARGVSRLPRSADVRAAARSQGALPRPLRLAAQGAGGGRRAQPARAARRDRQRGRGCRASPFHRRRSPCARATRPSSERARFLRDPGDILITTPESLYLMLTSNARERLRSVETVIIDEIHALVSTKRGAHMALSLERLERIVARAAAARSGCPRRSGRWTKSRGFWVARAQAVRFDSARREGDEGTKAGDEAQRRAGRFRGRRRRRVRRCPRAPVAYRDVTIIDASEPKRLDIRVQVPIEDMAQGRAGGGGRETAPIDPRPGPASQSPAPPSIWTAIHPRLLELIQAHRSTLIFVNSRRLAERLAGALNELAEQPLVRAHHGSLARAQRVEIEDLLKAGHLRGLVATSSLELGIDMGAIDLVVQIESPPSVASGLQRIGRAGHRIDEVSTGIIFPKFRGDLVACAAVTRAMMRGEVEPSRYPRNPLDVLAQQIVAMAAVETVVGRRAVRRRPRRGAVRRAEPPRLRRRARHALGPLSVGRVRRAAAARHLGPRQRARSRRGKAPSSVAIANAGTIPDRGLYGVFLLGAERDRARVGELDEEMVFEARVGETFLLGASTWRIEQITHDRVIVSPAPGPARQDAVLERRSRRPPDRAGIRHRQAGARAAPAAARASRSDASSASTASTRSPPTNLLQYLDDQQRAVRRRARRSDARHRAHARRARRLARARALVARQPRARAVGDGRRPRASATSWASRPRRCGATTGSSCGCRKADAPPDPALMLPDPDEVEGADPAAARIDGALRRALSRSGGPRAAAAAPASGRARAALAAAQARRRSAVGRGALSDRFRSSSRPTASACATSSICRRSSTCCAGSAAARCASRRSSRGRRRRLPRRCSSTTSPTTSTTATRRSPSAARRRWRSISRSCASSLVLGD